MLVPYSGGTTECTCLLSSTATIMRIIDYTAIDQNQLLSPNLIYKIGILHGDPMTKMGVTAAAALLLTVVVSAQTKPGAQQADSPRTAPPAAAAQPSAIKPAASAETQRALIDQYCVTCHNDRAKTANLSLQKLDLTAAGDHAEVWEKVVRKLRAGVMPPPGIRRPALTEYEGLRDWLEAEIDRKAASAPEPGNGDTASPQSNRIRECHP